jgi:predicted DNA-binding protein
MADQDKETLVMRIEKNLKERLENLSSKRKETLTYLTSEALKKYLEENEYTFNDVLDVVEKIPSLRIQKEKIKSEIKGCPSDMCKQIINTINNKQVFLFEEDDFDALVDRIRNLEKKNLYGIFIHITSEKQEDINKVNESLQEITEILKESKLNLGAGMKGNNHKKILLFVSYNKKESDDEKK